MKKELKENKKSMVHESHESIEFSTFVRAAMSTGKPPAPVKKTKPKKRKGKK